MGNGKKGPVQIVRKLRKRDKDNENRGRTKEEREEGRVIGRPGEENEGKRTAVARQVSVRWWRRR